CSQRQVCWAHLRRDFIKIAERTGQFAELGEALLTQQKQLFDPWYQVRDGTLTRVGFIEQTKPIRGELKRLLKKGVQYEIETGDKTPFAKTVRTCRKMLTVEPAFWTFVEHDGVEPTNNAAERALRPAVLWRKQSFGVNSQEGRLFVARMMTTVTSLKAQQRSIFDFLSDAVKASRHDSHALLLIPEED
ncbi:MAG: transposase, partial [Cyanobacteria bacterium J06555_12]